VPIGVPSPGASEADRADLVVGPGVRGGPDELVDGADAEVVVAVRPVDRDGREAVLDLVDDLGELVGLRGVGRSSLPAIGLTLRP